MPMLDKIRVAGFKSIRDQEIELRPLNVMVGANGAGKSNLLAVFRLLKEIVDQNLQVAVRKAGGADRLLHFGRKHTEEILLSFRFGDHNAYSCRLVPTADDSLAFAEERAFDSNIGSGHKETNLRLIGPVPAQTFVGAALASFQSWRVYHFHDIGDTARVKQTGDLHDNEYLRDDGGNLAAFLYRLQRSDRGAYQGITDTVRLVAPFFRGFHLRPDPLNPRTIRLEWQEQGSDAYFDAHALSDGTLRFICLAALLLQSDHPPFILVDEPELGLHPFAITILADLLRAVALKAQLLVSTQSVTLVNRLSAGEILVADRRRGESVFRRLDEEEIAGWLDEYALGELWEKNVLGGRPA